MTDSERNLIIRIHNTTTGEVSFYGVDSTSGGWPYFPTSINQAQPLTRDQAERIIAELREPNEASGFPNPLLHRAAGISNAVLIANLVIEIGRHDFVASDDFTKVEITARNCYKEVEAEKAARRQRAIASLTAEQREALGL